ncbi:MAG: response regulator, partial [Gemmataceae bacterium]|nr:response regulator [Gemmataceae bacterium]
TLAPARAAIAAAAPDLVPADWRLPDGRGIDLLPPDGVFPVVVMTSFGNEAVAVEMIRAGAVDYLVKSDQLFEHAPGLIDRALRTWEHVVGRRDAERALLESEARTAGIVDTAADAIVTADADGTIETVNPATERTFGYPAADLIGRNVDVLLPEPLAPGKPREVVARRRDGSTLAARLTVGVMDLGGRRVYAGILHDLTAFKRVERQFHQAQKMEAIGQLAGGVAHDFNNLLTVIMGYGSLLQGMLPEWDPKRPMLDEIVATADRAAGLTRQLLAVSRAPAADPVVLDPNRVVGDLTRMLQRLMNPGVHLETVLDPAARYVRVDPSHLEQVLLVLAVNARDAIHPGSGTVRVATALASLWAGSPALPAGRAPGEYVVLTVADTGVGMTDDVKARVFEPFFTTKEPGKGTGLGLATVFGVVRHAGGFVTVDSAPCRGSTFAVHLPRVVSEEADALPPDARFVPPGTETVLLADDDPAVQKLARMALESAGYVVLTADDGVEAVEVADRHAPRLDLIVTDLVMPRLGGLGVVTRVRQKRPGLPAVVVSGYPDISAAEEGVHVMRKPFTPAALARKVRDVLDQPKVGG